MTIENQREEAWLRLTDQQEYNGLVGELESIGLPQEQAELVLRWAWTSGFTAGMFVTTE